MKDKVFNVISKIKFLDGIIYGAGATDLSPGDIVLFNNNSKAIVSSNTESMSGEMVTTLILLGEYEERFIQDYKTFTFIKHLNYPVDILSIDLDSLTIDIDLKKKLKNLNKTIEDKIHIPDHILPKIPTGFYYCVNELHLEKILRDNEIYRDKNIVNINIRWYPCLITIDNKTLECGRAYVYSLNKHDFKELEEYL